MNPINKKKVNDILVDYKGEKKDSLVVFGKGPSFEIVDKKENEIFLCVNDAINHIDNCDFVVINDVKNMRKIKKEKLKNLKNLLIPYHIHVKLNPGSKITRQGPKLEYTYENFKKEFDEVYNGNLIVYNLRTIDANHPEFINLKTDISSAHNGIEFLTKYLPNVKNIETYGIGGKKGYHELFVNTVTKEHIIECCSQERVNIFKEWLLKFGKNHKLKINN